MKYNVLRTTENAADQNTQGGWSFASSQNSKDAVPETAFGGSPMMNAPALPPLAQETAPEAPAKGTDAALPAQAEGKGTAKKPEAPAKGAEKARRDFILDFLEAGENGFGFGVLQSEIIRVAAGGLDSKSVGLLADLLARAKRRIA